MARFVRKPVLLDANTMVPLLLSSLLAYDGDWAPLPLPPPRGPPDELKFVLWKPAPGAAEIVLRPLPYDGLVPSSAAAELP